MTEGNTINQHLGVTYVSVDVVEALSIPEYREAKTFYEIGKALFSKLLLPESYTYIDAESAHYGRSIALYVAHPNLPCVHLVPDKTQATYLAISHTRHEDGTVTLARVDATKDGSSIVLTGEGEGGREANAL